MVCGMTRYCRVDEGGARLSEERLHFMQIFCLRKWLYFTKNLIATRSRRCQKDEALEVVLASSRDVRAPVRSLQFRSWFLGPPGIILLLSKGQTLGQETFRQSHRTY